jgi:hypothetical protein
MYDRGEVACHLCFSDKVLRDWIKEESFGRGKCPWCGRRGRLIYLTELSDPFRKVVELYTEASGPEYFRHGERIGDLLDYRWGIFSEELVNDRQKLIVAILTADLFGKELYDYPDYEGLFYSPELSLEEDWDAKASAVLTGELPKPPNPEMMNEQREFGQFELVFEDLIVSFEAEQEGSLFRARIYDDPEHKEKYTAAEVGAPPREKASAGRANQAKQPVLYLANNRSTALAEVRPWKGAAVAIAEMRVKQRLSLVDLSQVRPVKSPFFEDLLKWRIELVQIDGCEHWWFEDRGPQCTLLVFIDDATSRLMRLQFVESESTFAYFHAARAYLEAWGKPIAFYSDKHRCSASIIRARLAATA